MEGLQRRFQANKTPNPEDESEYLDEQGSWEKKKKNKRSSFAKFQFQITFLVFIYMKYFNRARTIT